MKDLKSSNFWAKLISSNRCLRSKGATVLGSEFTQKVSCYSLEGKKCIKKSPQNLSEQSGGLVVKILHCHCCSLGQFPSRGKTPPIIPCYNVAAPCCCDATSYATGISNTHSVTHGGQVSVEFQTRQTKIGLENPRIAVAHCMIQHQKVRRWHRKTGQGFALLYTDHQQSEST